MVHGRFCVCLIYVIFVLYVFSFFIYYDKIEKRFNEIVGRFKSHHTPHPLRRPTKNMCRNGLFHTSFQCLQRPSQFLRKNRSNSLDLRKCVLTPCRFFKIFKIFVLRIDFCNFNAKSMRNVKFFFL